MSPPPISIDISGVVSVFPPCICAITGAAMPKLPPMIAKAATNAAIVVVLIKYGENTIDLKDTCEYSIISFAAHSTVGPDPVSLCASYVRIC
jgi:hypothetical protein